MNAIEDRPITSKLFGKDIRSKDFIKEFEKIFEIEIEDFLSDYEYDEIDEFPIEMENRGIMIGFCAETTKVPSQIEYIDLEVYNHPRNIGYSAKKIPVHADFKNSEDVEVHLTPFNNIRIYYSLYDGKKIDWIIFQHEDLRYELALNKDALIARIRVCLAENESTVNMRTYYLFDSE
ncbi:hypothetical protein EG347_19815 [Chryseobacterium sp. G0186]|uniref:hypothetical protein n=1 Tax=Chryseobacterium sp. G0186 TaxID=2487064 RepID=UPI000F506F08|nr:hypothetical protein [Chryseobacterium sp. G0186]AZA79579.1 hypothetical protein EG347_19815 [Chryseobacterium sp. G0186]